ncbi:MAG: LacI family DNA-binding transcriptional regulator, partial [Hymenobacter sp.]
MVKCIKCDQPDAIVKAGFLRGRQRYFCKACEYHFLEDKGSTAPPRRRDQATIGDVARQVGVAPSTVSRALNGHSDISPATRQAILD